MKNIPTNTTDENALFDRVVSILEQARGNVVRAVNSNMVLAYWHIGREIVEEIQGGEERAEYGKQIVAKLSFDLTKKYGKGFSPPTLWNFRQFYLVYYQRFEILSPSGRELEIMESGQKGILSQAGRELATPFSPLLTWSHYRALMRVKNEAAREFYERESIECGWSKTQLERQIHSSYFERILAHQKPNLPQIPENRDRLAGEMTHPLQILKSPLVLEFLGLPDAPHLHESTLETAIINNLQMFLLELGRGFSFVARQKHIRFDEEDFFVDLVFYNYQLKCFLLIDLKIGKLTHHDVGQMDGYVRLFEDRFKVEGDNPTIGLILCSNKSEAVAKYSVLNEGKQIFASKYLKFLPSEKELMQEIEKERRMIELAWDEMREVVG
jgi:predicted nuclease of restriction endonuclease-like (RecB) superfamily